MNSKSKLKLKMKTNKRFLNKKWRISQNIQKLLNIMHKNNENIPLHLNDFKKNARE